EVSQEALDAPDADRVVVLAPVAGGLARVVADATRDRGERHHVLDRGVALQVSAVLDRVQVALDGLTGRAGVVAGRLLVPIDGPHVAEVAGREQQLPVRLRGRGGHAGEG